MASIVLYQGSPHYTVVTASKSPVQAIVFDLDGVLFTTSKKMYTHIVPYFPLYAVRRAYDMKPFKMKDHYLEMLNGIDAESKVTSYHEGKAMPPIMIDWQTGSNVLGTVKDGLK